MYTHLPLTSRDEPFPIFYGLWLLLDPLIFDWQNASCCLSFWIIFSNNIQMFLVSLISWSIVIPHSLLLQWRTVLVSFPSYLTCGMSQWQWQHNLDVWNSSTSTTPHHFCNLFFSSLTGPLWHPHIMLSWGLPQFPKPTKLACYPSMTFLL